MYATFERDKLDPNWMLLQVGFAMAYSSECQNEYQSGLWSRRSVNVFTDTNYIADGKEESFLIVINSPDKGKNSVCTFMLKLVDEIAFKDQKKLIVYSDGQSSEFKNQFITGKLLYLLSQHRKLPVSWK